MKEGGKKRTERRERRGKGPSSLIRVVGVGFCMLSGKGIKVGGAEKEGRGGS